MRQQALMWLVLRPTPDKRPQMQYSGIHCKAGITVQPHPGDMPKMQRKSYRVQQKLHEDSRNHRSGVPEQNNIACSSSVNECSLGHSNSNGLEQSGAWP